MAGAGRRKPSCLEKDLEIFLKGAINFRLIYSNTPVSTIKLPRQARVGIEFFSMLFEMEDLHCQILPDIT
ncbi:hypothetical protein AB3S75_001944 [Citrus x aurantiifolia]